MKIDRYAIVTGGAHFNALGIVRGLGEAGIKVVYINIGEWGFAENSKYVVKTIHIKSDKQLPETIKEIVNEFGGKPPVYPSSDFSALILDENRDELEKIVICPGCGGKLCEFIKKDVMCQLAEEAGFRVPKTKTVPIDENFRGELEDFPVPFILKPVNNFCGSKNDIFICTDKSQIDEIVDYFKYYKTIMIQTYLNGKENLMVEYCGCKTPGKKVNVYGQLEKIREYPVDRGSTSYAVIKKELTYVDEDTINKLLELSDFNGVFDLELKVVDGVPYFIEVNYRNGAPAYAFAKAGFNIPATWYEEQMGAESKIGEIKETKLMCEGIDMSHVFEKNISIFTWIKNYITADAHMIVNKKDMKPFFGQYKLLLPYIRSKLDIIKNKG